MSLLVGPKLKERSIGLEASERLLFPSHANNEPIKSNLAQQTSRRKLWPLDLE